MYDLVLFDLDGTLIDSVADIGDALSRTLGKSFSDRDVARWVGSGVTELLRRAGADGSEAELAELSRRYRAEYAAQPVVHTRPYLRVKETLAKLPQPKAIVTNKPGGLARTIADKLALTRFFELILGEDDVGARKPDPLIVDIARGKFGVARPQTLYVGDSLVDAATARAAGVDLCLVTYGYADREAIAAEPATFHIDRFDALEPILAPK